ncbi:MAG TPA: DUF456 family protein [Vicinamibacterales bacterium]|nr:DUF456 family protein [Vicinamibacterales bacterium]
MTVLLWILGVAMVAIGLAGIVLPALPGHMLILAGLMVAAWADGFRHVSGWTLGVIAVIALASYGIDFVSAAVSTRKLGASRRAMAGAAIGTLGGLFFGLPGLIAGPFVGAVIGELTETRDMRQAGRAGLAATIGFAIGTAVKVAFAFVMIAIFAAAFLF